MTALLFLSRRLQVLAAALLLLAAMQVAAASRPRPEVRVPLDQTTPLRS